MSGERKRSRSRLLGILALLLLLALLLPLSDFLAGLLPGGGRFRSEPGEAADRPEPGTLRVTVVSSEDRAPVDGAVLTIDGVEGGRSGPGGGAVLAGLGAGPVRVEVAHDGSVAAAWADPSLQDELQLAVAPPPTRVGRVQRADGSGVAARVALLDEHGDELEATRTDAQGRYELPDDPAAVAVCACASELAPASEPDGDIVLAAGREVRGHLTSGGKGPLEIYGDVPGARGDRRLPLRATWTLGDDGSFLGRLPDGARAWALVDGLPVRIREGEIQPPARVDAKGRVVGPDGAPADGARLLFRPLLDDDFPAPLPGLRVDAADGKFNASGFAAARYAVEVDAPGLARTIVYGVNPADGEIEIQLERGFDLRGFVVDSRGLPVDGARVLALGLPENADHPLARSHTDARGGFLLRGLGGDHARVRVTADGYWPTTLEQVGPDARLRVVLQAR